MRFFSIERHTINLEQIVAIYWIGSDAEIIEVSFVNGQKIQFMSEGQISDLMNAIKEYEVAID